MGFLCTEQIPLDSIHIHMKGGEERGSVLSDVLQLLSFTLVHSFINLNELILSFIWPG